MDNMLVVGVASFLGAFAANLAWSWWNAAPTPQDETMPGMTRPKRSPAVAIGSGAALLAMTAYVMSAVSSGEMAVGVGAIAILITVLTVLAVGRSFMR